MIMVFCKKLQQELPSLSYQPFPGDLGEKLVQDISQPAWELWLNHQTKLINEYRLDPLDPKSRDFLESEMLAFLYDTHVENMQAIGGLAKSWDFFEKLLTNMPADMWSVYIGSKEDEPVSALLLFYFNKKIFR